MVFGLGQPIDDKAKREKESKLEKLMLLVNKVMREFLSIPLCLCPGHLYLPVKTFLGL